MVIELENEVWKDISGFEGEYQVSSYGRIKLLAREGRRVSQDKILTPRVMASGKRIIGLRHIKDRKISNLSVSAIVAKAFIDNPNGYRFVIHKDGDASNDHVSNLEYASTRRVLGKAVSRKCGTPVKCVDTGHVYPSIFEACHDIHVAAKTLVTAIEQSTDIHGKMYVYADRSEVDYDVWY